jgi:squalene-hopene cyclase-like protein
VADRWQRDGECLACHHHAMVLRVTALAEARGIAFDHDLARSAAHAIREVDDKYAANLRPALGSADGILRASMETGGDVAFGNGWFLAAELAAHLPAGASQQTIAAFLARIQQHDGRWRSGPYRGVMEPSEIVSTALVAQAIAGYGTADAKRALRPAARWLASARPITTIDHAFRLIGLAAVGRDSAEEVAELRRLQHEDGSWSYTPGPGDAYATGAVVVALVEAGRVPGSDPAVMRAGQYLLRRQEPDGSWLVPSRAPPILPYHDRGFPGGTLQFVSFAATAWATLALMYSEPFL